MVFNKRRLLTLDIADYVDSLRSGICPTQKQGPCERVRTKKADILYRLLRVT